MDNMFCSPEGAAPDAVSDSHHRFDDEEQQPRQDQPADHDADDMDPEERAYHERFMREAISMVNHLCRHRVHSRPPTVLLTCDSMTGRASTQERRDTRRMCLRQGRRDPGSWYDRDEPHPQWHQAR